MSEENQNKKELQNQKNATKDTRSGKQKKSLAKTLMPMFVIGFCICLAIIILDVTKKKRAEDRYSDMQQTVNVTEQPQVTATGDIETASDTEAEETVDVLAQLGITVPEKSLDWESLHAENADIYAWVYIPGTEIDYPVLQHPTEQDYYLDHNLDGSVGYPGCIYTQLRNNKDFTDFATILYGHNMKDGTMFQNLHNYEDQKFFEDNPYIYIYTPDKVYVYKVFAAVTFHDRNILMYYDMEQTSGRAQYINDIRNCNGMTDQHDDETVVNTESHIISLSTCIGASPDNRWIVSGVLLN